MRGRLVDLSMGMNRKQRITIEVDRDFRADFDRLKDAELDVEAGTAMRPPRLPWLWNTGPWPRMPTG